MSFLQTGPISLFLPLNINDAAGNGNGLLDYGETVFLTIGLSNVGTADASSVTADISTGDEYIGISDASATYGNIPAGETVTITDGFEINALENIPDLHLAMFELGCHRHIRKGDLEQQLCDSRPCPGPGNG